MTFPSLSGPCLTPLPLHPSIHAETHATLQSVVELETGEYAVTVLVSDSGVPSLSAYTQVNVTVCTCDSFGDCTSGAAAISDSRVGISFLALIVIMTSIALLLCKSNLHGDINTTHSMGHLTPHIHGVDD